MDMSKLGGDSQNTMPIAINAGMQARQIAQASQVEGAKFSIDAFKQSLNAGTGQKVLEATRGNLPIADALQQQGFMVRWAQKIPFVGEKITQWLGADGAMNKIIGELPKDAVQGMNKVQLTKALYGANTEKEIMDVLKAAKIDNPELVKSLADSAKARLASAAGQAVETGTKQAVTQVAERAATAGAGEIAANAASLTLKKGFTSAPTIEAIEKALASPEPAKALGKLGFYAKDAKAMVAKMTSTTVTEVAESGVTTTTKKVVTETTEVAAKSASKGGIKGFFGKLLGGAKGNFIVAGVFSLASNAIQLAQGKIGIKQFVGLTVADTAAYGAIGWGSAAAGAAIGTALFPGVGSIAGFVIGLGLGFVGGHLYEKFIRNPLKNMLGGPAGGAQQPYTANNNAAQPQGPAAVDPYANQNPGAGAPVQPAYVGADMSYEQAMAEIRRMGG
jgi:hypothetical protein